MREWIRGVRSEDRWGDSVLAELSINVTFIFLCTSLCIELMTRLTFPSLTTVGTGSIDSRIVGSVFFCFVLFCFVLFVLFSSVCLLSFLGTAPCSVFVGGLGCCFFARHSLFASRGELPSGSPVLDDGCRPRVGRRGAAGGRRCGSSSRSGRLLVLVAQGDWEVFER